MLTNEKLWVELYRPKKLDDCILPTSILNTLQAIVDGGKGIPPLLFSGSAGSGKTTCAKVLCDVLDYEYLYVNMSKEGRYMDTLRTTIADFAGGMSLSGRKKVVIMDEFDGISNTISDALRGFFEEYSASCTFILTANHKYKISEPIRSRFAEIDFVIPADEKKALSIKMMKRLVVLCEKEGVQAEKQAIAELVSRYFPDFRKTINELQKFSMSGKFDMDSIKALETPTTEIVELIRGKNFKELRKLVATASNIELTHLTRELYDLMYEKVKPSSIPEFVVMISDYNYKSAFVTDQEIIIMALCVELMASIEWL